MTVLKRINTTFRGKKPSFLVSSGIQNRIFKTRNYQKIINMRVQIADHRRIHDRPELLRCTTDTGHESRTWMGLSRQTSRRYRCVTVIFHFYRTVKVEKHVEFHKLRRLCRTKPGARQFLKKIVKSIKELLCEKRTCNLRKHRNKHDF